MCELSQVSLQMIKQTLRHHRDLALKESLEYGAVLSRLLNLGADVDEGIAAFPREARRRLRQPLARLTRPDPASRRHTPRK